MRVLYLDLVGGAAGDMLLAALIDAGASMAAVSEAVAAMQLKGVSMELKEIRSAGYRARQLDVMIDGQLADSNTEERSEGTHHHHHHKSGSSRPYLVIKELLEQAPLSDFVRDMAQRVFARLASAESEAHGVPQDEIHFHEVGSDDAIVDIVGVSAAMESLAIDEVVVSPVPLARGLSSGAHGPLPLPGPATLYCLQGAEVAETNLTGETVTPTGAALLTVLASRFGPIPSMTLSAVGVGAGHKSWPDRPNIVRALVGSTSDAAQTSDEDCIVETNLDDLNPQHLGPLERALFAAGALDVWSAPIQMKKGRTGILVSALVRRNLRDAVATAFFSHSTTLGVRISDVQRIRGERRMIEVETPYGAVRVKVAERPNGPLLVMPEHDDCERLATEHDQPVRAVTEAATRAAWDVV